MKLLLHRIFNQLGKGFQLLVLLKGRIFQLGKSCKKPVLQLRKNQDHKESYCPYRILGWGKRNQLGSLNIDLSKSSHIVQVYT